MAENEKSLSIRFGADTTPLTEGIAKAKQKLAEYNTALIENKQKTSETAKELKKLYKEQERLSQEIEKSGEATEKQKAKMQALNEKIAQTTANLGQLKAAESDIKAEIKAASDELQKQKGGLDENSKSAGTLQKALDKLGTAAKTFIGVYGAKKLWELLIGSNEEMEQYQTSFEVMLGDTEKAKALITEIQNFAAKTPLTKFDSVSIGSLLMNYGVESDELIDKMTRLGDLAGGNVDRMNRIALAYGQMLAKGKVTGEEMMQMTEAGVPLQKALAESIGVTGEEFSKMVSQGKVGIDDLDKAIEGLTSGNGKFAGMMEKQSETMKGMLSTLQDNVSEFFRKMGEGAFGEVKDVLAELMVQLDEWEQDGTLQEWAEELGVSIKTVVQILRGAIEIFVEFGDVIVATLAGKAIYNAADKLNKKFAELGVKFDELKTKLSKSISTASIKDTDNAMGNLTSKIKSNTEALKENGAIAGKTPSLLSKISNSATATNIALVALTVAVGAIMSKMQKLNEISDEYNRTVDSIEKNSKNTVSSTQAEISMLENKVERYDELRTAAELTAAQETELKNVANDLQKVFGDEINVVNNVKGSYNDLSNALEDYTRKRMAAAEVSAAYSQLEEYLKEENRIRQELEDVSKNFTYVDYQRAGDYASDLPEGLKDYSAAVLTFLDLNHWINSAPSYDDALKFRKLMDQFNDLQNKINPLKERCLNLDKAFYEIGNTTEDTEKKTANLANTYEENKEAADKLTSSIKNVNSAYLEQKENGKLSYDTIMSLVEAGYASCLQIDEETNSVKLNTEAYKKLAQAKLEARMTDLRTDIADIEAEYNVKISEYTHSGTGSLYGEQIAASINRQKDAATAEAKAELAALQDLYNNMDSYVTAEKKSASSTKKKEADESREAIDKLTDSIKKVNSAYKEQNENGKLSYDTAMSLIDAGYAACIEKDRETGAVKLNTKAYKELAKAKIEERMNDLKAGDITSEVTAELAALQDLYDNLDTYITENNGNSKKNKTDYSEGYEAYKTEADKKLALINKELAAKKELRDKTIAYLDEEIKKRRELNQDDDMQKEIDRVKAQLEYAQLDDFSRGQLEKKLKNLKEEQGEILWERDIQRKKDEADRVYEQAAASASKVQEQINNSVATVKQIIDALKDGVTNINNVINSNNTVNNSANISLANQYLTMAQITKAVRDALIGDVSILIR